MGENLTARTIYGLKWSYFGTVAKALLQIGFTATMARLLDPEAFGLMAMAGVILSFGQYFAQMGIGSALIQKSDISSEDIKAAFTSAVLLGLIFTIAAYICAPLAMYIFDSPESTPIIRTMAITFFISGMSLTAVSLLRRDLAFEKLVIIETFSYIIGGLIGIVSAFRGFGVWSLVAATISQGISLGVLSYLFYPHDLSFIFQWRYYKHFYSFGSRVSAIGFFEFINLNLDTLAIGRIMGANPLGIYNRAFMLVNLPTQYFSTSISRVLFPSFCRVNEDIDRLKAAYLSTVMLSSSVLLPMCSGIAAAAGEIVPVVLGDKWVETIPIIKLLAMAASLNLVSHFGGVFCEASGVLNYKLLLEIVLTGILAILLYLLSGFGLVGFSAAMVVTALIRFSGYLAVIKKRCKIKTKEVLDAFFPAVASSILIGAAIHWSAILLRSLEAPLFAKFIVEFMIGVLLLLFLLIYGPQRKLRDEIRYRLDCSGLIGSTEKRVGNVFHWLYKVLSPGL